MAVRSLTTPIESVSPVAWQVRVSPHWVVAGLVFLIALGGTYLSLSHGIAAASNAIQQLEAQKRVQEARNQQLRLEIAELRSLRRVSSIAHSRLGMRPAVFSDLAYVLMPEFAANPSPAVVATLASPVRQPETIRPTPGPAVAATRPAPEGTPRYRPWWERLAAFIAPGARAEASEDRPPAP